MKCKLCTERGQTWSGSPPVCAFESGQFSSKNWNCATCIAIRARMEDCDAVKWVSGDQRYGTLPLGDEFNEYFDDFVVCVWATWYKSRGKTDVLFFLTDSSNVITPTENDCLHFLSAGESDNKQGKDIETW